MKLNVINLQDDILELLVFNDPTLNNICMVEGLHVVLDRINDMFIYSPTQLQIFIDCFETNEQE